MQNKDKNGNYIAVAKCGKCKADLFAIDDLAKDKADGEGVWIFKKPITPSAITTNEDDEVFCTECYEDEDAEPIGEVTGKKNYEISDASVIIGKKKKEKTDEPEKPSRKRSGEDDGEKKKFSIGPIIVIGLIVLVLIAGAILAGILLNKDKGEEPVPTETGFVIDDGTEPTDEEKLNALALEDLTTDLKVGDIGHQVEVLQAKLFVLKYYNGEISGFFSTSVEDAVRRFQNDKEGLKDNANGIVDEYTRIFLNGGIVVFEEKLIPADAERIKALEDEIARLKAELAKKQGGGNTNPDPTPKPTPKPSPTPTQPSPTPTPTQPSPTPTPTPTQPSYTTDDLNFSVTMANNMLKISVSPANGKSFPSGTKFRIYLNGSVYELHGWVPWDNNGNSIKLDYPGGTVQVKVQVKFPNGDTIDSRTVQYPQ